MSDRRIVVAMSRWDERGVSGRSRRFEGRVGVGVRGSIAYDGMGLSRQSDYVCRCSDVSLESKEHRGKRRKRPQHALGYYSESVGHKSDLLFIQSCLTSGNVFLLDSRFAVELAVV